MLPDFGHRNLPVPVGFVHFRRAPTNDFNLIAICGAFEFFPRACPLEGHAAIKCGVDGRERVIDQLRTFRSILRRLQQDPGLLDCIRRDWVRSLSVPIWDLNCIAVGLSLLNNSAA